jgi:two-component system sensor histidine kinase DesK
MVMSAPESATGVDPSCEPDWRPGGRTYIRGWFRRRPNGPWTSLASFVWLAFIVFPLINAIAGGGSPLGQALTIAGAAAFSAGYVWLVLIAWGEDSRRLAWGLCGFLLAIAIVLTLAGQSGWAFLFTYCAACIGILAPSNWSFQAIIVTTALAIVCCRGGGGTWGGAVGSGASAIGIGLLLMLMRDLRLRNDELTQARAELARAAVSAERERFARDLHDLLGHTLSVVAIKAELAGRLIPDRPDQAAREVADVERVARTALGEVRDAVSGYRRPTLDGELAGARMALSAAGIDADVERPPVTLHPGVEAVLAWAVREGATNVIRHSGARRCSVTVRAGLADAAVEVRDDGTGCQGDDGTAGHGLVGLAERAETLRGRVEAGALPEGGFRLNVSVPVGAA